MKVLTKKLVLSVILMLFVGSVLAQNSGSSRSNERRGGSTTITPVKTTKTKTPNKIVGDWLGLSFGVTRNDSVKSNSYYIHALELGPMFGDSPFFVTLGIAPEYIYHRLYLTEQTLETKSWNLHIPAYAGLLIGFEDDFHIVLRAGAVYNYLLSSKDNVNGKLDLSGVKRSTWDASFRITVGFDGLNLLAQYDLPISGSDRKGVWRFGFCFGL